MPKHYAPKQLPEKAAVKRDSVIAPAVSPLDLTDVETVLQYLATTSNPGSASDSGNIQLCITSASIYWLWRLGLGNIQGGIPETSPLVEPVEYDEFYDGSGGFRQFTRQRPIVSVSLVQVGRIVIPASIGIGSAGWVIDSSRTSISLRNAQGGNPGTPLTIGFNQLPGLGGYRFYSEPGLPQNIRITYMAGFDGTPPDIFEKATKMVAVNYKRKQWLDQASQAMADGAGTIRFRDWELDPDILQTMRFYSRKALAA